MIIKIQYLDGTVDEIGKGSEGAAKGLIDDLLDEDTEIAGLAFAWDNDYDS